MALSAFGLRNEFPPLPSTKTAFLVLGITKTTLPSTKVALLVLGIRFFPLPSTKSLSRCSEPTFIPTLTVVMADLIGHLLIPGPDPGSPVQICLLRWRLC